MCGCRWDTFGAWDHLLMVTWLTDPDGYRIELVQWPSDHPAGMTAADFA
jgi:hypothetical protein